MKNHRSIVYPLLLLLTTDHYYYPVLTIINHKDSLSTMKMSPWKPLATRRTEHRTLRRATWHSHRCASAPSPRCGAPPSLGHTRGRKSLGEVPWENHRKTMGKPWENGGLMVIWWEKPWENHRKIVIQPGKGWFEWWFTYEHMGSIWSLRSWITCY